MLRHAYKSDIFPVDSISVPYFKSDLSRSPADLFSAGTKVTSQPLNMFPHSKKMYFPSMQMKELMQKMAQPGTVRWIGLRTIRKGEVKQVDEATLDPDTGIVGDHYSGKSGQRHVTLIQAEHLVAVASILNQEVAIDPLLTRRNLVVSGINLVSLKEKHFRIGDVLLEATGPCAPCSQMENNLGEGGYNAMRGHGGICAKVIEGGTIRVGDEVRMMVQEKA